MLKKKSGCNFDLHKELLDCFYDGIYYVDLKRVIQFWNKSAEGITGFSAEEVIGKCCYSNILNHVDLNSKQLCIDNCPLHETLQDGIPRKANVFLHHKDGFRVPVTILVIPVYADKEIIGAMEVFASGCRVLEMPNSESEWRLLALY